MLTIIKSITVNYFIGAKIWWLIKSEFLLGVDPTNCRPEQARFRRQAQNRRDDRHVGQRRFVGGRRVYCERSGRNEKIMSNFHRSQIIFELLGTTTRHFVTPQKSTLEYMAHSTKFGAYCSVELFSPSTAFYEMKWPWKLLLQFVYSLIWYLTSDIKNWTKTDKLICNFQFLVGIASSGRKKVLLLPKVSPKLDLKRRLSLGKDVVAKIARNAAVPEP
jgi:hypothetical protein